MTTCPCRAMDDKKTSYEECCAPYIKGTKPAPTAEALMRSRYSAYAVNNMDYIEATQWHEKAEVFNKEEAAKWATSSEWLGLKIVRTVKGQTADQTGVVEFIAHYKDKQSGKELEHKEVSSFEKEGGQWKFRDGNIQGAGPIRRVEPKIGRNDPCACGSGKKYKKCCAA